MADPVAPDDSEREGTRPIFIVGGTILVVVMLSFVIYEVGGSSDRDVFAAGSARPVSADSAGACGFGPPDDSYSVAVVSDPDPPRAEGSTFRLTVRQGGRAVTGAKVCMLAEMPTMQHPGLSSAAKESPGGRYEILVKFGMGGPWQASVIIAEPGKSPISVTVPIEVAEIAQN